MSVASLLLGCDGSVDVDGKVYNTTAKSTLRAGTYDTDPALSDKSLTALPKVNIVLFHSSLPEQNQSGVWQNTDQTDSKGKFSVGGACAPGRDVFSLEAAKNGYRSIATDIKTVNSEKQLYVVLAPLANYRKK